MMSQKTTIFKKAAVMWTVNDFPTYVNLIGWSTKGKLACLCCCKVTTHHKMKNGSKKYYMGQKFLLKDHPWRDQKMQFDGKKDKRDAPMH